MENKILKRNGEQWLYAVEECRAAVAFDEFMEKQGFTYNPHGDCDMCEAQALCDCICPFITLVDKRDHNSPFYCALVSELRTGETKGYYECKSKKTIDGGVVQSSYGIDRVPVEPHGDVY